MSRKNSSASSGQDNLSKESSSLYTPKWMSPKERAKLKARLTKIKERHQVHHLTAKEDVLLLKAEEIKNNDGDDPHPDQPKPDPPNPDQPPPDDANPDVPKPGTGLGKGKDKTPSRHSSASISSDASPAPSDTKRRKKTKKAMKKKTPQDNVVPTTPSDKEKENQKKEDLKMVKKPQHPKAEHANPSGNKIQDQPPWLPHPRDTLEAHLWATDFTYFSPQLYTFKTPEKLSTRKPVVAECPPFWVLCDHTIAVAWKLFRKDADRRDLGIVALQWSREFLSAMKDESGEYPFAVKHLLFAVEDALIDRYSHASEASKKAHAKGKKTDHEDAKDEDKKDKSKKGKDKNGKDAKHYEEEAEDDIAHVSSESIYKPPVEASYTLRDIMSRNFPGRKLTGDEEPTVKAETVPVVQKGASLVPEYLTMTRNELIAYLVKMKEEQEIRLREDEKAQQEIDAVLKQVEKGDMHIFADSGVPQSGPMIPSKKKYDHVEFDTEAPAHAAKPKKKTKDLAKVDSTISSKSSASNRSVGSESNPGEPEDHS